MPSAIVSLTVRISLYHAHAVGLHCVATCDARIAAYVLRSGPQRLRESEVPADQVVEYWGSRHLLGRSAMADAGHPAGMGAGYVGASWAAGHAP